MPGTLAAALSWVAERAVPYVIAAGSAQVRTGVALAIVKLRSTGLAGFQSPSPAWLAVMVQMPAPVIVTVEPATSQAPEAVNETGSPEDAVALTVNGASP